MALPNNVTQPDIINYLAALDADAFEATVTNAVISAIAPVILQTKIDNAASVVDHDTIALANAQAYLASLQS